MTDFTMSASVPTTYDATLARVRELLAEAGFGVLTEIDVAATLRSKLGVDTPPRVILGACRPQLAHLALAVDPRIATLLPCNIVVGEQSPGHAAVEVLDPIFMTSVNDAPALREVAEEARERLAGMLSALTKEATDAASA